MSLRAHASTLGDRERFGKFLLVGLGGLLIDNAVLIVATMMGSGLLIGKMVSAETAIITMFFVNEHWTFRGHGNGPLWKRFLRSNAVRISGVAIAYVVLEALVSLEVPLIIANTAGIICGFAFNYTAETLYTWAAHR